ncbi:transcription-repair coupling factor [Firmicutes bacterium CAG:631]|nr:transcription-repair coupling factor [Firmicutes bacterium CAG:631]
MALTGVRGFSTITTPIENRMPVQTYVLEKNDYVIKEIIERELARGGQVYYLHNRIEELPKIALKLKKSIRNAKIAIVHGQLPSDEMEDIMETFIRGETNILCCTTVIENGIDIPNVNTIIVENADCFGLSQLYQIRGRVGRSDRLAYAYLFYKSQKNLSELAQKRLTTIKEFTQLGSGYKVAMRDLITRGAGDLLGAEQSGFIESVGMDMYIDLLHEAIEEQKNGVLSPKKEAKPKTTLQIDAYIPQGFFNNDYEKIELYRQIDQVEQLENLNQLKEEIIDKTGKLPESIRLLFEKKVIDIIEQEGIIENYRETDQELVLKLSETFSSYRGVGLDLFELANQISTAIVLKFPHMRIEVHVKKIDQWLYLVSDFVKGLVKIQKKYQRGN